MRLDTGIVILSMHKDRRYVSSLPLSETHGWAYLLKQNVPDMASVLRAIQGSVDGMVVLDPEVVESLQPKQGSPAARLTPRHRRVLELIAQRLTLTEKSVETYINAIYQVLQIPGEEGMHSRVKATLVYVQYS